MGWGVGGVYGCGEENQNNKCSSLPTQEKPEEQPLLLLSLQTVQTIFQIFFSVRAVLIQDFPFSCLSPFVAQEARVR